MNIKKTLVVTSDNRGSLEWLSLKIGKEHLNCPYEPGGTCGSPCARFRIHEWNTSTLDKHYTVCCGGDALAIDIELPSGLEM